MPTVALVPSSLKSSPAAASARGAVAPGFDFASFLQGQIDVIDGLSAAAPALVLPESAETPAVEAQIAPTPSLDLATFLAPALTATVVPTAAGDETFASGAQPQSPATALLSTSRMTSSALATISGAGSNVANGGSTANIAGPALPAPGKDSALDAIPAADLHAPQDQDGPLPAIADAAARVDTTTPAPRPETPLTGVHATPATPVQPASSAANQGPPVTPIETPLNDARWADDFGQRIVWLSRGDVQNAQISINPPNLGPIEIALKLGGDQATAVFTSAHSEVREALESALPRLREMMAGAGIQLGQTQVNSQSQQQGGGAQHSPGGPRYLAAGNAILSALPDVNSVSAPHGGQGVGLIDLFA